MRLDIVDDGMRDDGHGSDDFDVYDSSASFANTARAAGAPLVAVTGAEYLIGAHVVKQLLERGAYVRAVVTADDGGSFLRRFPSAPNRLQIVTVIDYFSEDEDVSRGLKRAFKGACAIVHALTAAPHSNKRKSNVACLLLDELENVIEAASVRGTSVRRLVYISSELTVYDPTVYSEGDEVCLTEKDWYNMSKSNSSSNSLAWSHTVAEERLWKSVNQTASMFTVCSVVPSFVLGPILSSSHVEACPSVNFLHCMLSGILPTVPPVPTPPVDVRDLAWACIELIDRPEVSGRILLCAHSLSALDLAAQGAETYPRYPWPTAESTRSNLPLFGKSAAQARRLLKDAPFADKARRWQRYSFSQDRARAVLRMEFRPPAETIRDTIDAFVKLGCVADKRIEIPEPKPGK